MARRSRSPARGQARAAALFAALGGALGATAPAVAQAGAETRCAAAAVTAPAAGRAWHERRLELLQRRAARRFGESVAWRLGPAGVELCQGVIEADAAVRYRLRYVVPVWRRYQAAIAAAARRHGVPAELILAALIEESGGRADAVVHYPGYVSDDATPQRVSIGIGQMLLSTAQRLAGRPVDRAYLLDPVKAIDLVARFFAVTYRSTGFDPPLAAAIYNAGGLRSAPGAANRWKLANGRYVDRFVAVFNASVAHLAAQPEAPAESFARLFGRAGRD